MKLFRRLLSFSLILLALSLAWRARPVMTPLETNNDFFPKEAFLAKITSPTPDWMLQQLAFDFQEVRPVVSQEISEAYTEILERLPEPIYLYHYRILDNQLYKYIPLGTKCSSRDTFYERALKTLLSHTSIPDVDFLICPMDGVPEAFLPQDFYLLKDGTKQVPILGQAKKKEPFTRLIVLIPDQFSISRNWFHIAEEIARINGTTPWEQKIGKAFWRGGYSDNGIPAGQLASRIEETPRLLLCRLSQERPDWVNAGFASADCPFSRSFIEKAHLKKPGTSKEAHLQYKYQLTLDGHMCTYPGFQWRLLSDTLTLKQESDQIQWFYSALESYKHYLPVANDMSDVVEKVQWAEEHPGAVREMIAQAQQFAKENLLVEDCYRYLYLVLQKYASYQQIDFVSLKRETKRDPRWINIQYRKRMALRKMFKRIWETTPFAPKKTEAGPLKSI